MSWPRITYCVITYNEEKNIRDCLNSIFDQDYPKDKIEVILIDDKSTDNTVEIAKQFPVKVLINGKKDGDLSLTMGFEVAMGEFYTGIGADMRLRGKDWLKKMVKPLMENKDMAVAITKYYSYPKESLITKYLNLDPFQRDLVYQFFSPNIEDVISEKKEGYCICEYSEKKIPLQVHGLYRISTMKKIIAKQKIWYDMGNLVLLVKMGYTKFGYVPNAGMYHFHAENLKHLLKKRMRNIRVSYLKYMNKEDTKGAHYRYFNLSSLKDIFKLSLLVISANLFIPIFLFSIYRMIKYKNWVYLLEAPITFLLVNTIIYAFLKDSRGRIFIKNGLTKLFLAG